MRLCTLAAKEASIVDRDMCDSALIIRAIDAAFVLFYLQHCLEGLLHLHDVHLREIVF